MAEELWDDITEPSLRVGGARVLVADDAGDLREMVAGRLAVAGYEVEEACSGEDLLRLVRGIALDGWPLDGVDLLVVDYRMSGLTGLETIRALRAAHCDTPAILMTAFPEDAIEQEAAAMGVALLPKPFSFEALARAVMAALARREG